MKINNNSGFWINKCIGNNAFSWEERKSLGSQLKIYVANLIEGKISDLKIGKEIAFEEIKRNKNKKTVLDSHIGLKYFVKTERAGKPLYIVDNHNHVLSFRHKFWLKNKKQPAYLVHIDQHTDMNIPETFDVQKNSLEDIFNLVNNTLNVGNFIVAAQQIGIVDDVVQINTEYTLNQYLTLNKLIKTKKPIILDIDMDFRSPEMGIKHKDWSFEQVKKLCRQADLITIATSPYFIDQKLAIELVGNVFV